MKRKMSITGMFVAFVLAASSAYGQAVQIANVTLSVGSETYAPSAVNNNQWVVGVYTNGSGTGSSTLGFLNVPGSPTQTLAYPGSTYTRALGVNDANTVVGDFFGSDGVYHGYIYYGGSFDPPAWNLNGYNEKTNKFSTSLFGIASNGNLAGAANPHGSVEGFVVMGSTTYEFYPAGKDNTYAYAVNSAGIAVGQYFEGTVSHGFMFTPPATVTPINYTGAQSTACYGINDFGVITCTYVDTSGNSHGFEINSGGDYVPTDLMAVGVSNSGYMVGSYVAPGGSNAGFLLSPGPGPGSFTDVPVPYTGAKSTSVYGIDINGDLAGSYVDSKGKNHGLLLTGTSFSPTTIDYPKAANNSTVCYALNATDDVVCDYTNSSGNGQAVIYNGNPTQPWSKISIPGAAYVVAFGINKLGQVAGTFGYSSTGTQYGFLQSSPYNGTPTQLSDPDANGFTLATGVNKNGEVVAWWGDANNYIESSSYEGGAWVSENFPGATNSYIGGVDDQGDLSYTWSDPYGNLHGGFYSAVTGNYYLFDYPGATGTRSYGIVSNPITCTATMVGRYYQAGQTTNFNSYTFAVDQKCPN
ncbi:MAG: hypothetical protein ACLQLC_08645 [Candidatus Sulfotelmatobacter sp.]